MSFEEKKAILQRYFERVKREKAEERAGKGQVQGEENHTRGEETRATELSQYGTFDYIPKINLYVSRKKFLHGKNWQECQEESHRQGLRIPTLPEFWAFINHHLSQNTLESKAITDEVLKIGNWRAEHLDARFEQKADGMYMHYFIFNQSGSVEETNIKLDSHLRENKLFDFTSINAQGLPSANSASVVQTYKQGKNTNFYPPINEKVAGFNVVSGRAYLYCVRVPSFSLSSLGVRFVARSATQKNAGGITK